ncbi:MAG: MFS transporter [Rubrivivax sp.]
MTQPRLALAAMLAVQVLATLALSAASVLAPAVAPRLGLAPERVGLYAALAYLTAMAFGLRSGRWVARWGALPLCRAALLAAAAGAALAAVAPEGAAAAAAAALLAAAALIGLGYGLVNPAAAAVLGHHAPPTARGLYFSIKQTGVPLGVAVAGLLLPAGLAWLDWRATAFGVALACMAAALAAGRLRKRLEPPTAVASADGALALLRQVWHTPGLRRLSLTSLGYAFTQQAFVTFLVSLLNLQLGWTLAAAAATLSVSQGVATLARIGFGALADRTGAPGRLLVQLGAAMSLACAALAALAAAGPAGGALPAVAVALLCAATAMGWNGVFFAELAWHVPREAMARVSGATQVFTFAGGMAGPLLFGEALRAGSGWAPAYALLALVPAAAAVTMARGGRATRAPLSP